MGQALKAPSSLDGLRYFVVRYAREAETYEICLPNNGATYLLGKYDAAVAYFSAMGKRAMGERAMSAANSFGASQALIEENRAWGLDLTQLTGKRARLFGAEDDDDAVVLSDCKNDDERIALA